MNYFDSSCQFWCLSSLSCRCAVLFQVNVESFHWIHHLHFKESPPYTGLFLGTGQWETFLHLPPSYHLTRGGTYLQMFFFQPPSFVVVKFKIEKQHFIVFSKYFNPPRVVSIFHDLTQKLEFHTNFIRSVEG